MKPGQKVIFYAGGEVHEGIIVGPMCGTAIYIQPTDWPEQNFPHIVTDKNHIELVEDDNE